MPKLSDKSVPVISQGVGFYYMDWNLPGILTPSQNNINTSNQAIAYTMQQYYLQQGNQSLMWVIYNDENTTTYEDLDIKSWWRWVKQKAMSVFELKTAEYGHTKGVVFFNRASGFWLIHSVPKFPELDRYIYPENGLDYGQSILCMSFNYSSYRRLVRSFSKNSRKFNLGTQLFYNHPHIYAKNLPPSMEAENPDLAKVMAKEYHTGTPTYSIFDLTTTGGTTFKSFAKSADFKDDLYSALVAPTLKAPFDVESWRRSSPIPKNCSLTYEVYNVQTMKVENSMAFNYTKDHSKVGISMDPSLPYLCIGDINRMTSQFIRGGGTACINTSDVWKPYYHMIQKADTC